MKNKTSSEKKLNQRFAALYNYNMEHVAIQVRRFTRIVFIAAVLIIYVLWQLSMLPAELTVTLMVFFVLQALILSHCFLWQNNDIAYRIYARRASSMRAGFETQTPGDPDSDFIQFYEECYPMLYHRFAYILTCDACGFTQRMHERLSGLCRPERCLFRLLF